MKILGIDPGTGRLGWGLVEKRGQSIVAKDYGCIEATKASPLNERLLAIYRGICAIIREQKPDEVAIEELFFFKNQKTVISVAEARGVILLAATECGLPVFEYTPLQVKQALTGYGRAEKKQMQSMVQLTCKMAERPKPDDAADALAVAICHAQTCQRMLASK
ncbi:MAG: crossover junction endodeoxyribonuclease RuvC [Patescibacteria group bacterium]